MFLLLAIWIGWKAVIVLPLKRRPAMLILWQYVRMARPYLTFCATLSSLLVLSDLLHPRPGSPLATAMLLGVLGIAVGSWIVLGRLTEHFEFVRLLNYDNDAGTVTLRFSTAILARRASEVLIIWPGTQQSANTMAGTLEDSRRA
jgi:hypothetical protein